MKTVVLKNEKYCDSCPCFIRDYTGGGTDIFCGLANKLIMFDGACVCGAEYKHHYGKRVIAAQIATRLHCTGYEDGPIPRPPWCELPALVAIKEDNDGT